MEYVCKLSRGETSCFPGTPAVAQCRKCTMPTHSLVPGQVLDVATGARLLTGQVVYVATGVVGMGVLGCACSGGRHSPNTGLC